MLCAQAQGLLGTGGGVHIVEGADVAFFRLSVVKLGVGDFAPDVLAVAAAQPDGHFARADAQGKARQTGVKGLHVARVENIVFTPHVKGIAPVIFACQQFGNPVAQVGQICTAPFKNQGASVVHHCLVAQGIQLLPAEHLVLMGNVGRNLVVFNVFCADNIGLFPAVLGCRKDNNAHPPV